MLPRVNPTTTQAWFLLKKHHEEEMNRKKMKDLFAADADRFKKFSLCLNDLVFDYSKNIINDKTLQLLLQLADDCKLKDAIHALFAGIKINETEHRAVLHTALRNFSDTPILVDGKDVMPLVKKSIAANGKLLQQCSFRQMERLYRQENKVHCKYWYWWKRFRSSNGN